MDIDFDNEPLGIGKNGKSLTPLNCAFCAEPCRVFKWVFCFRGCLVTAAGQEVYLRDIWPTTRALEQLAESVVLPSLFNEAYKNIQQGNET